MKKHAFIHIQELSYSIANVLLYNNISLHINAWDKAFLLGPNGCGKSTLFHIIQKHIIEYTWTCNTYGLILSIEQELLFKNDDTIISRVQRNYPQIEEWQLMIALETLWLDCDISTPIYQLSWWQRKKLQFTPCYCIEVDIILLDEPTNHLDTQTIQRLQDFCLSWNGVLFCISHDRSFIDHIATDIYILDHQEIEHFVWNYSQYQIYKENTLQKQQQAQSLQQKEYREAKERLSDIRQRASVYTSPKRWKLLRSKEKQFDRTYNDDTLISIPSKNPTLQLRQWWGVIWSKRIVQWKPIDITINDRTLYSIPSAEIRGKTHIHLQWPNGCGKSTLLTYIYNAYLQNNHTIQRWNDIQILYLDQFWLEINSDASVLQWSFTNFPTSWTEHDIRMKLYTAGISVNHLKTPISQLSHWQRAKIRMIQMMSKNYDLLLLDEPTNHLDIETKEMFEHMLSEYAWSYILVSHDQRMIEQLLFDQTWTIHHDTLEILAINP